MSDIIPFDPAGTDIAVSDDVAALFAGGGNLSGSGEQVPTLSIRGKTFKISKDGNETELTQNVNGEIMPLSILKLVVVDQTPGRTRSYFKGSYNQSEGGSSPICHSYDGKHPASDAAIPQHANCDGCPMSVKDPANNNRSHCQQGKFLAIVPSHDVDHDILRLKLPITSVYDAKNSQEAQGWYAWDQYVKFLKARKVPDTCAVETSIKFDGTEYPKLLFKASGMLGSGSVKIAYDRKDSEETNLILGLDKVGDGSNFWKSADIPFEDKPAQPETPAPAMEQQSAPAAQSSPEPTPEPEKKEAPIVVDSDEGLASAIADWG